MRLREYLEKHDITQRQLAEKVGIHFITMFKIVNGTRMPSLDVALKIESVTFGKVTCEDFLKPFSQDEGKKKQRRGPKNNDDKLKLGIAEKAVP